MIHFQVQVDGRPENGVQISWFPILNSPPGFTLPPHWTWLSFCFVFSLELAGRRKPGSGNCPVPGWESCNQNQQDLAAVLCQCSKSTLGGARCHCISVVTTVHISLAGGRLASRWSKQVGEQAGGNGPDSYFRTDVSGFQPAQLRTESGPIGLVSMQRRGWKGGEGESRKST